MLTAGEGVFARTSLNAQIKNVFIFYFLNFFSFFYLFFFLLNEHLNQIHSLVGWDRVENIASSLIQVHWTQRNPQMTQQSGCFFVNIISCLSFGKYRESYEFQSCSPKGSWNSVLWGLTVVTASLHTGITSQLNCLGWLSFRKLWGLIRSPGSPREKNQVLLRQQF